MLVADADLVIGTSAGATAAVQIAGRAPADLLADILDAPVPPARPGGGPTLTADHLERFRALIAASSDAADMRRRVSEAAMAGDAEDDGSRSARWREMVAARLPITEWPDTNLVLTAVDARTSEPVTLNRASGIDLVDAVAASTSGGGLAHHAGDKRLLDGGYRRNENADLALGYGRVLVLSPLSGRTLHPLEWRMQLAAQVEDLEDAGSQVATVVPDDASLEAMGDNLMDFTTRPATARAGYEQGRGAARHLKPFWR